MRTLLFVFSLSILSLVSQAQNFEGVVTYKNTISGSGSEKLSSIIDSIRNIANFSTDGKIRETSYSSGFLLQDFLYDLKNVYAINSFDKTAQIVNPERLGRNATFPKTVVTPLGITDTILGYSCEKFQMIVSEIKLGNKTETSDTSYVWSTQSLQLSKDAKSIYLNGAYRLIPGVMLKRIKTVDGTTSVIEAILIKNKINDKSIFNLPKGYTVKKYDPKNIFGL